MLKIPTNFFCAPSNLFAVTMYKNEEALAKKMQQKGNRVVGTSRFCCARSALKEEKSPTQLVVGFIHNTMPGVFFHGLPWCPSDRVHRLITRKRPEPIINTSPRSLVDCYTEQPVPITVNVKRQTLGLRSKHDNTP